MRDYKNVKVPRSYRSRSRSVSTKRIQVVRGRHSEQSTPELKRMAVQLLTAIVIAAGGWLGWEAYREIIDRKSVV